MRLGIGIETQVPAALEGLPLVEGVRLAVRQRLHGERGSRRSAASASPTSRTARPDCSRTGGGSSRNWRWLAPLPGLVILDEPMAGTGAEETARTASLIRELDRDHAVVVVEHDKQFIRVIARTVTVPHQGRALMQDSADRVLADLRARDVHLGRAAA